MCGSAQWCECVHTCASVCKAVFLSSSEVLEGRKEGGMKGEEQRGEHRKRVIIGCICEGGYEK